MLSYDVHEGCTTDEEVILITVIVLNSAGDRVELAACPSDSVETILLKSFLAAFSSGLLSPAMKPFSAWMNVYDEDYTEWINDRTSMEPYPRFQLRRSRATCAIVRESTIAANGVSAGDTLYGYGKLFASLISLSISNQRR